MATLTYDNQGASDDLFQADNWAPGHNAVPGPGDVAAFTDASVPVSDSGANRTWLGATFNVSDGSTHDLTSVLAQIALGSSGLICTGSNDTYWDLVFRSINGPARGGGSGTFTINLFLSNQAGSVDFDQRWGTVEIDGGSGNATFNAGFTANAIVVGESYTGTLTTPINGRSLNGSSLNANATLAVTGSGKFTDFSFPYGWYQVVLTGGTGHTKHVGDTISGTYVTTTGWVPAYISGDGWNFPLTSASGGNWSWTVPANYEEFGGTFETQAVVLFDSDVANGVTIDAAMTIASGAAASASDTGRPKLSLSTLSLAL